MMTVQMDEKLSASSGQELAERLFKKNLELEDGLRRAAQSKIPSDPNTWVQMRENYEAIVLEDHEFSEKHEVEFRLWQLHYRRIEEFRSHINAAASSGAQGGKNTVRSDRIKKIRAVFKSFLSEATGFYHDLILKIRAKYGLPLENFLEGPENQVLLMKDEKRLAETRKGLLSCHRCLIYLGDLSRYKGLYGEFDSVKRDYTVASGYYMQSSSLWPSSGNPHHQLAIIASYSGDELAAVYRYFRSLAVESPFSTARDNLIIAFEKNRQSCSQLSANTKASSTKVFPAKYAGRGRVRGENGMIPKGLSSDLGSNKAKESNSQEIFNAFSIRFVRLHGILFTRTSLETFGEICALVISDLNELLSGGPQEELNFGSSVTENGLTVLMLIAILIFTVHNVKKESDGQSYAEILQRKVLLENAFTLTFEFAGNIFKKCLQLEDSKSSYLLPGILVFVEWLASHDDIAKGVDLEEKQAVVRSFFWDQYISLLNKLIPGGSIYIDSLEDRTFSDSRYDSEETGNRLALWEDFELRGFTPLAPAHSILDFSRKQSFGNNWSNKEKEARVQRILAAGRALADVVWIDEKSIFFDRALSKFVISHEPPSHGNPINDNLSILSESNLSHRVSGSNGVADLGEFRSKPQLYEGDDEEEEIVFKPAVVDKYAKPSVPSEKQAAVDHNAHTSFKDDLETYRGSLSGAFEKLHMMNNSVSGAAGSSHTSWTPLIQNSKKSSGYVVDEELTVSDGLWNSNNADRGSFMNQVFQQEMFPKSASQEGSAHASQETGVPDAVIPSQYDSVVLSGAVSSIASASRQSAALVVPARKNSVSRPVRHVGPPPGFSPFPPKHPEHGITNLGIKQNDPLTDDYSWLDGYQGLPRSTGSENFTSVNYPRSTATGISNIFSPGTDFPFPGKQISPVQPQVTSESLQNFQFFDPLTYYSEKQLPRGNLQQPASSPEQYQTPSLWSGNYFARGPFASR